MENGVLEPDGTRSVERAIAERVLAPQLEAAAAEARRLIDAAFAMMRETGTTEPPVREIVRESRLSNQAFYRHFRSKDDLLLAALADGQRRLVRSLQRRVDAAGDPAARVRAWIEGMMAQARNERAADATRPFSIDGARLRARFPYETGVNRDELLASLRPSIAALGGDDRTTDFVFDLTLAQMHDAIITRRRPTAEEVDDLVAFCLARVRAGVREH